MSRIRTLSTIAALALAGGVSTQAFAQGFPTTCGITATGVSNSTVVYDPFAPANLQGSTVSVTLRRNTDIGGNNGNKTDIVSFYFKNNLSAADGTSVVVNSVTVDGNVAGTGLNIFYDSGQQPTIPNTSLEPSAGNRFLKIDFTGANQASDLAVVNMTVTLPADLDLQAINNLPFDLWYTCSRTGGGGATPDVVASQPNVIAFPIRVRSGLRAGMVGTALAFGEIGDITTASLGSTPKYTSGPNHIRVQSSGPYSVQLTSQNNYRMTSDGTNASVANASVNYELKFLGETRSPSNVTPVSKQCLRAGVGLSVEDQLPMQAKLLEGGAGKVVGANYRDTLTVTVTPLAATAAGSDGECSALDGDY